eukprot:tig00021036_g17313.t1
MASTSAPQAGGTRMAGEGAALAIEGVRKDRAYFVRKAAGAAADAGDIAALVNILAIGGDPNRARELIVERGLSESVREELARRQRDPNINMSAMEHMDLIGRLGLGVSLSPDASRPNRFNTFEDIVAKMRKLKDEPQDPEELEREKSKKLKRKEDQQLRFSKSELCRLALAAEAANRLKFCSYCPRELQPKSAAAVAEHNASEYHAQSVQTREDYYITLSHGPEEMLQRMSLQVDALGKLAGPNCKGGSRPENWRALLKHKKRLELDRKELRALADFGASKQWGAVILGILPNQTKWQEDIKEGDRLAGLEPAKWDDSGENIVALHVGPSGDDLVEARDEIADSSYLFGPQPGARAQAGYGGAPAPAPGGETGPDHIMVYSRVVYELAVESKKAGENAGYGDTQDLCGVCEWTNLPSRDPASILKHMQSPSHVERVRIYNRFLNDVITICEDVLNAVEENAGALSRVEGTLSDKDLDTARDMLERMNSARQRFTTAVVAVGCYRDWEEGCRFLVKFRGQCVDLVEEAEELAGLPRRRWRRWPNGRSAVSDLGPRAFRVIQRLAKYPNVVDLDHYRERTAPPPPPPLVSIRAPSAPGSDIDPHHAAAASPEAAHARES